MSETTATQAPAVEVETPAQETTQDAKSDETNWQAEAARLKDELSKARKWEQRAKENKAAADRLAEIEESQKSEADKAAERLAEAERRAVDAEARATRRDIALEFRLDKDDAALLDDLTDETAMRRLAERLAKAAAEQEAPVGFRVDSSGRKPGAKPNKDDAARAIFGI